MTTPLAMPPQPTDQPRPTMQPAVGANRLEQIIRDQEKRINALERKLSQGNTDWAAPTFVGAWTNYAAAYPVQYRRLDGVVYLRGALTGGALGNTAFNLPPGFRSLKDLRITNWYSGTGVWHCYVPASTANVIPFGSPGSAGEHSLDGISFPAEA